MKQKFEEPTMRKATLERLALVNAIINDYQSQGYRLTLRQLYYQLVSKNVIPNNDKEYDMLGELLVKGRMCGIVDWSAIEDRVRKPEKAGGWDSPKGILESALYSYRRDRMKGQSKLVEVWVEKDALSGVLEPITRKFGISLMVNRGYSSASAMFEAYNRFKSAFDDDEVEEVVILYLGDHDPSGLDMVRDVEDRIMGFHNGDEYQNEDFSLRVEHIALTRAQITQYETPINPVKLQDGKAKAYIEKHGRYCWEVDALPPSVLSKLVREAIIENIDNDLYTDVLAAEETEKAILKTFVKQFDNDDSDEEEQEDEETEDDDDYDDE